MPTDKLNLQRVQPYIVDGVAEVKREKKYYNKHLEWSKITYQVATDYYKL